jgi:hypothetical protein
MLLKVGQDSTAVAVASDGQLLLFRILEGASNGALGVRQLADDIYPSLVYFQDNYGMNVETVLVNGIHDLAEISAALQEQTGVKVRELIEPGAVSEKLRNEFAGAIGALR